MTFDRRGRRQVVKTMASRCGYHWLRKQLGRGLALAGLLLALLCPAAASATEIHYFKEASFTLPFEIKREQQPQINRILLYVSDNGGPYTVAGQAMPSEK